jgi:hypothetical protein
MNLQSLEEGFILDLLEFKGSPVLIIRLDSLGKEPELTVFGETNILEFKRKFADFLNKEYPVK